MIRKAYIAGKPVVTATQDALVSTDRQPTSDSAPNALTLPTQFWMELTVSCFLEKLPEGNTQMLL
jgi:hypothetical protein